MKIGDYSSEYVYGFVGPSGGGKTYRLDALRHAAIAADCPFITVDFSDGVRATLLNILGFESSELLSPDAPDYIEWKDTAFSLWLPDIRGGHEESHFTGRDLLKGVGETAKQLCGYNVWARWAYNRACERWNAVPSQLRSSTLVAFGSVRFGEEYHELKRFAEDIHRTPRLIMCNYRCLPQNPQVHTVEGVHSSEWLAQMLLGIEAGVRDGADVTSLVETLFNNYDNHGE